jgi:hypothetical protein
MASNNCLSIHEFYVPHWVVQILRRSCLCSFLGLMAMLRVRPIRHDGMDTHLDTYNRMVKQLLEARVLGSIAAKRMESWHCLGETQLVPSQEHCVLKGFPAHKGRAE